MTYRRSLRHDEAQRFSIRKSALGAASVLLGTVFLMGTEATVRADELLAKQAISVAEAAVVEDAGFAATVADQPTTAAPNAVTELTPVTETETSEEVLAPVAEQNTGEAYAEVLAPVVEPQTGEVYTYAESSEEASSEEVKEESSEEAQEEVSEESEESSEDASVEESTETSEEVSSEETTEVSEEVSAEPSEEVSTEQTTGTTVPVEEGTVVERISEEVTPAPVAEEEVSSEEEPVEEETESVYLETLYEKRALLADELAQIEAKIAEYEALAEEERVYGAVLSSRLAVFLEELDSVQKQLAELNSEIEGLENELKQVNDSISNRQAELDDLEKNDPQAALLSDIEAIKQAITDKENRIKEIDELIPAKEKELDELADETALDQKISDKTTELNNLKKDLSDLRSQLSDKEKERKDYETKQNSKIAGLKKQLSEAGDPVIITVDKNEPVWTSEDIQAKSKATWARKGKKHELVRFANGQGLRTVTIELTEEQSAEYQSTESFTYTINPSKVEEYFLAYLEELRQVNNITIPASKLAAASDFARRRAEENAAKNELTHDTNLSDGKGINEDGGKKAYENAGVLSNNKLTYDIKSDQELAYLLLFEWFSDYNNAVDAASGKGDYGHRNNLLVASGVVNSAGKISGLVDGDGLGFKETKDTTLKSGPNTLTSESGWLHYLQNGYGYTAGYTHPDIEITTDEANNHYLTINGKTTPTTFIDAIQFQYVPKGTTTTTVNEEYLRIEKQLKDAERELESKMKTYNDEINQLEKSISEKEGQETTKTTELNTLRETKENLTQKRRDLADEIQGLKDEKKQLQDDIETLKQELNKKEKQVTETDSTKRRKQLKEELNTLNEKKEEIEQKLKTKKEERDQLLGRETNLTQDIKELEEKIKREEEYRQRIEDLLNELRRDRNGKDAEIDQNEDRIDDVLRFNERRGSIQPEKSPIVNLFDEEYDKPNEEIGRVTIEDSNGTGVSVNLSTLEGVVKVVVVKHIEPTAETPDPVERLAGQDYDLYDIKLIDENGNYVTDLVDIAIVKLPVDAGKVVERVIYLPEEGEAEDLEILEQTDGYVYFQAEHFSFYGIVYRKVTVPNYKPKTPTGTEKTTEEPTKEIGFGAGQSAGTVIQTGTATAVTTATSTETSSAAASENTLPNTGEAVSLLSLLGAGLTAAGLVGRRKRR